MWSACPQAVACVRPSTCDSRWHTDGAMSGVIRVTLGKARGPGAVKDAAMNQPAKAQEPSMEEILASIRRIIADDDAAKPAKPEPATRAAVDAAFNSLAQTVLVQNARTLEDLVKEMLRPMLKSWLDDNLPTLVERLVRAEIERVSRGSR